MLDNTGIREWVSLDFSINNGAHEPYRGAFSFGDAVQAAPDKSRDIRWRQRHLICQYRCPSSFSMSIVSIF